MQKQDLTFTFHNPNSEKDTYNFVMKIFTEAGCRKLKTAIAEYEKEKNSPEHTAKE